MNTTSGTEEESNTVVGAGGELTPDTLEALASTRNQHAATQVITEDGSIYYTYVDPERSEQQQGEEEANGESEQQAEHHNIVAANGLEGEFTLTDLQERSKHLIRKFLYFWSCSSRGICA